MWRERCVKKKKKVDLYIKSYKILVRKVKEVLNKSLPSFPSLSLSLHIYVCMYVCLLVVLGWNPGVCACRAGALPFELHPQPKRAKINGQVYLVHGSEDSVLLSCQFSADGSVDSEQSQSKSH